MSARAGRDNQDDVDVDKGGGATGAKSSSSDAVKCLRQAIAILQDLTEDSPIVKDQAAILVNLIRRRHVEVVKGKPETKVPWLRLAMDLEADEVDVHIRLRKGRWLDAGVNHIHK